MPNEPMIERERISPSRLLTIPPPDTAERLKWVSTSSLFAGLSEHESIEIVSCAFARAFGRNELLFAQGQPVRNLILLQSGNVKHTQVGPNGNEVLLRINGTGDVVDVRGEFPWHCHTCAARATEKCKALVWEYSRIQGLLARYPQLARNLGRILVAQLQELEERFREVATENVDRRLALLLIRLGKQIGKLSNEGVRISLSREELAQMAGATGFTISRVLTRWSEQGFVVARREAVIIRDLKRLEFVNASGSSEM